MEIYKDESWLRRKYGEGLSMRKIAKLSGCSAETVRFWLMRYGIKRRSAEDILRMKAEKARDASLDEAIKASGEMEDLVRLMRDLEEELEFLRMHPGYKPPAGNVSARLEPRPKPDFAELYPREAPGGGERTAEEDMAAIQSLAEKGRRGS